MPEFTYTEGSYTNGRNQILRTYSYNPTKCKCVFFFHHGFGEYSGRAHMPKVFRSWAARGIAVHTYDAHAHGHSEPKAEEDRFLIWNFSHVVDDFVAFTKHIRTGYKPGVPMFIGGHSMGSLAAIHVALKDQTIWDGLILGTATVDVEWNWFLRLQASIGSLLAMLIPRAQIVPAPPAEVNADDALEAKIAADPLLATGNVRARTANELLRAFAHVQKFGELLWLPIYAHHGTQDHLASIEAVRNLLERCASADITMHEVEGGAHELFVGAEREQVTQFVGDWIDGQLAAKVAAAECEQDEQLLPLSGNPFQWVPQGGSPLSSVYGGSPRGCSPVGSPRLGGRPPSALFDDVAHWPQLEV